MRRLVALLRAGDDQKKLVGKIQSIESELADRVRGQDIRLIIGVQLEDDPIVAAATETGREIETINAVIQVESDSTPDGPLLDIFKGLGNLLGDTICHKKSAILIGDIHVITPAVGEVLVAVSSRRKQGLSLNQMHDHWLYQHAPMALAMLAQKPELNFGYDQLHVDPIASARASRMSGMEYREIDALLQIWCRAPEDYLAIEMDPEFVKKIYEDDLKFTDMSSLEGACLQTWSI